MFLKYFIITAVFYLDKGTAFSKTQHVTCGSVIKLMNVDFGVRLHSHDIKYGSGSGQQSVTCTDVGEDVNSHWVVKGETGKYCVRGAPIQCGAKLRLQHLNTQKNLHSHHFHSPLSANQEISAYGEDNGEGDSGDHWELICNSNYWERDGKVVFKHVDTGAYLSVSGRTYNRPIYGQYEVIGTDKLTGPHVHWISKEGVFIQPSDFNAQHSHQHTEL